jgi:hypothetical protein
MGPRINFLIVRRIRLNSRYPSRCRRPAPPRTASTASSGSVVPATRQLIGSRRCANPSTRPRLHREFPSGPRVATAVRRAGSVPTCPMSARHIASTGHGPVTWRERVPETVRFKYRAFLSYSHPDTGSANVTGLQAELEAAFRKLPITPPDDGRIPHEWVIPGIGRQLALMKPVDRKVASPDATKRKLVQRFHNSNHI